MIFNKPNVRRHEHLLQSSIVRLALYDLSDPSDLSDFGFYPDSETCDVKTITRWLTQLA
jgi:hypothetical protein